MSLCSLCFLSCPASCASKSKSDTGTAPLRSGPAAVPSRRDPGADPPQPSSPGAVHPPQPAPPRSDPGAAPPHQLGPDAAPPLQPGAGVASSRQSGLDP